MGWVKDILKRVDWVALGWIQGPRLAILPAFIFGISPVAKTVIALLSLNTPGYVIPSDFWWLCVQSLFWLVVLVVALLMLWGQFLDWKEAKQEQVIRVGSAVYRELTGKEFPRV